MGTGVSSREQGAVAFDTLYANQRHIDVINTVGTYKVFTAPTNMILKEAFLLNTVAFVGGTNTLTLGVAGTVAKFVADTSFDHTANADPAVILIDRYVARGTVVNLYVGGSTTGTGKLWVSWRPLP